MKQTLILIISMMILSISCNSKKNKNLTEKQNQIDTLFINESERQISALENFQFIRNNRQAKLIKGETTSLVCKNPKKNNKLLKYGELNIIALDKGIKITKINKDKFDFYIPKNFNQNQIGAHIFIQPNHNHVVKIIDAKTIYNSNDSIQICFISFNIKGNNK